MSVSQKAVRIMNRIVESVRSTERIDLATLPVWFESGVQCFAKSRTIGEGCSTR